VEQANKLEEVGSLVRFSVGGFNDAGWKNLHDAVEKQSDFLPFAETSKDDMAFLSYTSGTTGNPKGVVHTHGWAYAHLRTTSKHWLGIEEKDVVWATASPGWQKWIWSPFLSTLGSGATGFVYHGKFDPNTYLKLLEKYEVNVLCCTPTEYRIMAKVDNLDAYSLPHLHSAVSAGEPLNREVIDTFRRHFEIDVRDGYGQTENTLLIGVLKGMEIKSGSMGKPTPGNRVTIINDNAEECEVGDPAGLRRLSGEVGDRDRAREVLPRQLAHQHPAEHLQAEDRDVPGLVERFAEALERAVLHADQHPVGVRGRHLRRGADAADSRAPEGKSRGCSAGSRGSR
jgi:acetyl-CoA synthetase